MATVLAASGVSASEALREAPGPVVVVAVNGSTPSNGGEDSANAVASRATPGDAAVKPEPAAIPDSSGFTLLGLGVVMVGVIARQRRRFRRSGTILLR